VRIGLVGRRRDVDSVVDWVLDPIGAAKAVEVVGDPGIGKTALIDTALARLGGQVTVRTAATAVEQPLTWAGLAQVVDGWPADDVAALSSTHRRALDGTLGRSDGPPEPGVIAIAVASLVEIATARGPAVVVVDDAHWLDDATAGVLAFAVRANRDRPVRLIAARRPLPTSLQPDRLVADTAHLRVELTGLSPAGVHELLSSVGIDLGRPQLVHVHDTTGGNPLHVLELARLLHAGATVDEAVRQTSLESMIGRRVRALTPVAQAVLGAAALTATPTVEVLSACFGDDTVAAALTEAEQAQLVTVVGTTLRFTHPTVGAAAEAALGGVVRRRLHAELATLVADDERALHLDASSDGPDADVAAELDASARDAWDRGAIDVAAKRMLRAIERTPPDEIDVRWQRRIAAADMLLDAGAGSDAVAVLADDAEPRRPADVDLAARVVRVRASGRFQMNDELGAAEEAAAVADMFPVGHPTRVDALLAQARITLFFDVPRSIDVAAAAAAEAPMTGDERLVGATMACELSSRFLAGEPVTIPTVATANSRRMTAAELLDELLLWGDEPDRAEPQIVARLVSAEQRGDIVGMTNLSQHAGEARLRRGDLHGARRHWEQYLELASTMDDRAMIVNARAGLALVNGYLGALEVASTHAAAVRDGTDGLAPGDISAAHSTAGTAVLLCGDPAAAVDHFRVAQRSLLAVGQNDCNALPFRAQMVEALVDLGRLDEAREVADELTRFAERAGRARGIGDAHRGQALVAAAEGDLDRARSSIGAAIVVHDSLPGPVEGAWSRLVAGVVERRARKRAAARAHFEQALAAMRAVGAESLARRAEAELARAGVAAARLDELTAAEAQVASLVAQGHTNAEVAAMMHVSTRTVESNLTRIYRKLGIRSRTELAALGASAGDHGRS
jgi:DNA-binding CsgD family transcriptional regulator